MNSFLFVIIWHAQVIIDHSSWLSTLCISLSLTRTVCFQTLPKFSTELPGGSREFQSEMGLFSQLSSSQDQTVEKSMCSRLNLDLTWQISCWVLRLMPHPYFVQNENTTASNSFSIHTKSKMLCEVTVISFFYTVRFSGVYNKSNKARSIINFF